MPRMYEAIRDKLRRQGLSLRAAKRSAARIYNAKRKPGQPAVSPAYAKRERARARYKRRYPKPKRP